MENDKEKEAHRRALMLETPIPKLIPKMAVPTIVAMLISSIYSIVDTFFVSFLGTSATAAVGVNMSLDLAITMAGSFLAFGASSYIARLLGSNNKDAASKTLSTAFFVAIFLGVLFMLPGLIFTNQLVVFLGASESSIPFAIDYARYLLIAAPFTAPSLVLNMCLRSEGSPIYSMVGIGFGGVLNIALAPLFIFTLNLGVAGAAMATAISKFISFCFLIYPYLRKKSILTLSIKKLSFRQDIVRETTLMGAPSLFRMSLSVIANIFVNNIAGRYSVSALAAISVVSRIMMLPTSAILGFGQGFQPVAGFNWGAKSYNRVRKSFRFSAYVGVVSIAAVSLLMAINANKLLLLFTKNDISMIEIGVLCLIAQCLTMPLNAWVVVVNMLYSALGKPTGAIILGITRQGICFIPVILIFPTVFGISGLAVSQAVADVFSFIITVPFAVLILKDIKRKENHDITLPKTGQ